MTHYINRSQRKIIKWYSDHISREGKYRWQKRNEVRPKSTLHINFFDQQISREAWRRKYKEALRNEHPVDEVRCMARRIGSFEPRESSRRRTPRTLLTLILAPTTVRARHRGREARLANYKRGNRHLEDNRELASPVAYNAPLASPLTARLGALIARYEIARYRFLRVARARLYTRISR